MEGDKVTPVGFADIPIDANKAPPHTHWENTIAGELHTDGFFEMSLVLANQVIQEALSSGRVTEMGVSKHVTVNYDGPLRGNASLVEQRWPIGYNPTSHQIGRQTSPINQ